MKVTKDALRLLDSGNDSDTCIESKFLPADLLSNSSNEDDETSLKNTTNDKAFHMFPSSTDQANNNSFEKIMPNQHSAHTLEQSSEGSTSPSSLGNYQQCGKKLQVSEFKVLEDDNSKYLSDKELSPTTKYSSIFSEFLFAKNDASDNECSPQRE